MFVFVYVLNMLQMGRLHGQCYPPLEKHKKVIIKDQSPYLSAFQFEKHDTIVSIGAGMMWREATI
jgi:hypothetical protein